MLYESTSISWNFCDEKPEEIAEEKKLKLS